MREFVWPTNIDIMNSANTVLSEEILLPFAIDEVQARRVGNGSAAFVHVWRHNKSLVIGLRDNRLPHADKAMEWFHQQGYEVGVRNSGGAAVPLDEGVVNISLIFPLLRGRGDINIQTDFAIMADFLETCLQSVNIHFDRGEIVGSYCPGSFDLSVNGRKFCGISQRRQANAFIIQAFIVVSGSGEHRAHQVKQFYDIAVEGSEITDYPHVQPEKMASLEELASFPSVEEFINLLQNALLKKGAGLLHAHANNEMSDQEVIQTLASLKNRYKK